MLKAHLVAAVVSITLFSAHVLAKFSDGTQIHRATINSISTMAIHFYNLKRRWHQEQRKDPIISDSVSLLDSAINYDDWFSSQESEGISAQSAKEETPEVILKAYTDLKLKMPEKLHGALFARPFNTGVDPELDHKEWLEWADNIGNLYEDALRFERKLNRPRTYVQRMLKDIRGFLFFQQEMVSNNNLLGLFSSWQYTASPKNLEREVLRICYNHHHQLNFSQADNSCHKAIEKANTGTKLYQLTLAYFYSAQRLYNSLLEAQPLNKLRYTRYDPGTKTLTIPFADPGDEEKRRLIKQNIEHEWSSSHLRISIEFKDPKEIGKKEGIPSIRFVPGVVPTAHPVTKVITMDSNIDFNSFHAMRTLRHEFGHVLGFKDCYIEFYNSQTKKFTYYEIDTTNIMCSHAGRASEIHYKQLKALYAFP